MKKLYFIVPIVGAIIFFFFYSAVKNDIKAQDEQRKIEQAKAQAERVAKDVENRQAAFKIAFDDANRRIEAARIKEAEIARKAEETQAAKDARDLAYRERERQYKRLMELTDNRLVANEQLAKVQEQISLQKIQETYLGSASREVAQTKQLYEVVLSKMDAAEKAAEAAAKLAAAAAKKN